MTTLGPVIPRAGDLAHARRLLDAHTGPRRWDTAWAVHRIARDTNSACAVLRAAIPACATVDRGTLAHIVRSALRARYYADAYRQPTTTPRAT